MKPNLRFCLVVCLIINAMLLSAALPLWGQEPAGARPTLIDFSRSFGCVPCKQMEVVLDRVKGKYGDQVAIRMLLQEQEKELFSQYKIFAVPTQVFLDADGREMDRHMGYLSEAELVKKLQDLHFIKP